MRLATLQNGTRDGRLVVVSPDGGHSAAAPMPTLQAALENWAEVAPALEAISHFPDVLDPAQILAPLPRAWQWLDGSVYPSHGALMDKALNITPFKPDWPEMRSGFGWIQAKPPCGMAPFAITPDELGDCWRNARPALHLAVDLNGQRFGNAYGEPMAYGFDDLVAHAARTRNLVAGTVIGSGTVSNENFREVGSSCIAERRGIEIVDHGEPRTEFMKYGDRVRMEAHLPDGRAPFGAIEQRVVKP